MINKQLVKGVGLMTLLALAVAACTPEKKNEYNVTGTISGVDSGMVKLIKSNREDRTSTTVDSLEFTDGSFVLSGKLDNPEMMTILITPGNWRFNFFMENNDIKIIADTTGAEYWDYTGYGGDKGAGIKNYTVQGSKSHDLYRSFEENPKNAAFKAAFADLNKRFGKATEEQQTVLRNESDSIRTLFRAWEENAIDSFVNINPSSVVSAYLFWNHYQFNEDISLEKMESIIGRFREEASSSPYYKLLDTNLKQRVALKPGNIAPDFTALKPDSTEFTLSSTSGKYVLLDFWASWCVPCRQAIPHWKELYNKYQDNGLEIVGITNDSRWGDWRKALEQENMPWIQVADDFPVKNMPARIATQYMIPFLPSYTLLDPTGKILLHNAPKEDITKEIEARLN